MKARRVLAALGLPLLVGMYPALNIFAANASELTFHALWAPLAASVGVALLIFGLSWLVIRKLCAASLAAALLVVIVLGYVVIYGLYNDFVHHLGRLGTAIQSQEVCLGILLIGATFGIYKLIKSRRNFQRPVELLVVIMAVLNLLAVFSLVRYKLQNRAIDSLQPQSSLATASASTPSDAPDIYYIILDRYASSQTLNETLKFDNSKFLTYLANTGFSVKDSHANYPFTIQSLASSLNGEYLPTLSSSQQANDNSELYLQTMIQNNGAASFFKGHGYSYTNIGSWWDATGTNSLADVNLRYRREITLFGYHFSVSDYASVLLRQSILAPKLDAPITITGHTVFASTVVADQLHRNNTLYQLDQLQNHIPQTSGPKFVFAHILFTHPPYVFDTDGNWPAGDNRTTEIDYVNQMIYANQRLTELVATLTSGPKKPIIILQADEGPYPERFDGHTDTFNWNTATAGELQEKTGILNAYYFPDGSAAQIPATVSPVNVFREIINHYFGGNLPILPDNHYIDNSWQPYKFIDIDGKLTLGYRAP